MFKKERKERKTEMLYLYSAVSPKEWDWKRCEIGDAAAFIEQTAQTLK